MTASASRPQGRPLPDPRRHPLPPWGDREIARFTFRVELFKRRGMSASDAETWADRLYERDYERDDRRMCIECEHLQADHPKYGRGCFQARNGRLEPGTPKNLNPVIDLLQRCSGFSFQRP